MEIVNVLYNGLGNSVQKYSDQDIALINNTYINTTFGDPNDYIETFISDENGDILSYNYNLQSYFKTSEVNSGTNKFTSILIDPEKDVKSEGFTRGKVSIQYNFLKNLFNSKYGSFYWIKEISTSRLELKLSSQTISGNEIKFGLSTYQNYVSQKNYYGDFYLNFGNNNLIIAVNAAFVNDGTDNYLIIKLYEPLPLDYDVKSQLWIVDKLAESAKFDVDIQVEAEQIDDTFKLRGPNFKVEVTQKVGQTTPYYSYNNLFSAPISSSIRQLMSYYDDKALSINVDYSDFNNFIHFSSATERINNFVYKLGLIESYNSQIYSQASITGSSSVNTITTASINLLQSNIDSIIEKFDTYEYYLYYESGAFAWPKSSSSKPYLLYSTTSSKAINWLGSENILPTTNNISILYSASIYDKSNKDALNAVIPQYLLDDPNNQPYVTFIDMVGQHFDNIWIYYKDVTNRFNATNNPNTGISLDMVAEAIKGLGVELYTNTNLSNSNFYSLFGINSSGTVNIPTGSEGSSIYPINYVTSSLTSLPYDQIQKEVYKRLYHNLPYLLKTRGTERGVKALISCYGIPDSILTINEFGGTLISGSKDIFEINDTKINIISQNELSQSLLSRGSTLQQYSSNYRKNSLNVEVGFSPSDIINANITSSLNYSIDQLIGNPSNLYSSSYQSLDAYKDNYFRSYNKNKSVWEYIRLIKFYNNSLFKMIKDFVPARANVSTGIIIKPHILERNKYARKEPSVTNSQYSQSIDLLNISAYAATSYSIDTTVKEIATSSIGYIPVTKSFGFENFTGEFSGTKIIATALNSIGDQTEVSKNSLTSSRFNFGATLNNVVSSVRSTRFFDLDYTSNAITPINFGVVTESIDNSITDKYNTYINLNSPYAELQDFNYFAQRSTIPRYYGSKVESQKYNVYTNGDTSYGNSPAIDHRTVKLALFTQIKTSSFFPGQSNANLTYLVDQTSGLQELNLLNNNWFELQNTFKSNSNLTIKQFDNKKYSNQKFTDGVKKILESGYSYSPILYFNDSIDTKLYFIRETAVDVNVEAYNYFNSGSYSYLSGSSVASGLYNSPLVRTGTGKTASVSNLFPYSYKDTYSNAFVGGPRGVPTSASTYNVNFPGDYKIESSLTLYYTASATSDIESASFAYVVKKNGIIVSSTRTTASSAITDPAQTTIYLNSYSGSTTGDVFNLGISNAMRVSSLVVTYVSAYLYADSSCTIQPILAYGSAGSPGNIWQSWSNYTSTFPLNSNSLSAVSVFKNYSFNPRYYYWKATKISVRAGLVSGTSVDLYDGQSVQLTYTNTYVTFISKKNSSGQNCIRVV